MLLWPLLELLDGPSAVVSVAAPLRGRRRHLVHARRLDARTAVISVAAALSLVAFLTYNKHHDLIGIHHAKEHTLANETFVKWNSFSRIAIEHDPGARKRAWRIDSIRIDADASDRHRQFRFRPISSLSNTAPCCWNRTGSALRHPARRQSR